MSSTIISSKYAEELLFDDRICSNIPILALRPLTDDEFFHNISLSHIRNSKIKRPNLENIKSHLLREGLLSDFQAFYLCECVLSIFKAEPNLLKLPAPINICGDIHGQFYDMIKIFSDEVGGGLGSSSGSAEDGDACSSTEKKYLFLGDYVDRGLFSMECLFYLFSLKITFPDRVYMLRGNHESAHMTQYFTFQNECTRKYSHLLYTKLLEIFNALPLCAVVNNQLFCVHGGISPSLKTLKDIDKIDRFQEPPSSGLYCDLMWSDPSATFDFDSPEGEKFSPNRVRGCSYIYHFKAAMEFLNKNNLLCIIRAHEAQSAGFRMYKTNPTTMFPAVITLFSAPNYVDVYNNKAAIMYYDGVTMDIRQFSHSPHPYHLPNLMDAFSWSMPFVAQKISDLFLAILTSVADSDTLAEIYSDTANPTFDDGTFTSDQDQIDNSELKSSPLVHKIRAVSKLIRTYNLLRTERESIIELKALMRSEKLPCGTLALGAEGIRQAISSFDVAKRSDIENEHVPPEDEHATSMRQILTPFEVEKEMSSGIHVNDDEKDSRKRSSVQLTEAVVLCDRGEITGRSDSVFIPPVIINNASSGVAENPKNFIYEDGEIEEPLEEFEPRISSVQKFLKSMCGSSVKFPVVSAATTNSGHVDSSAAKKTPQKGHASFEKYRSLISKYIETKFPKTPKYPKTSSINATFPFKELSFLVSSVISSSTSRSDETIHAFIYKHSIVDDEFKLNVLNILLAQLLNLENCLKKPSTEGDAPCLISVAKRIISILLVCAAKESKSSKDSSSTTLRKAYTHCWGILCKILFYSRCHLPLFWSEISLLCFSILPRYALTQIDNPGQFMDLLKDVTENVAKTGEHVLFVLALDSLLVLVTKFRLDVPNFYSLIFMAMRWLGEPRIFRKLDKRLSLFGEISDVEEGIFCSLPTPKATLFTLLEISLIKTASVSLSSATLPAAFAKRASQLLLVAPAPTAMWLIPFIYELIQAHSGLIPLIHRPDSKQIPYEFVETESDPLMSTAINSSLWELDMVRSSHINASVSAFISIFSTQHFKKHSGTPVKRFQLSKYHDISYASMAEEYSLLVDKPKRSFQCALSVPHPGRPQPLVHQYDYARIF
ncbi:35-cyclic-nucleotide phosphodiesterase (PDEase) (35-CNP) [Mitosporidium daphniae]